MDISKINQLSVNQVFEGFELLGYETRNKYEILDENNSRVAFAAEQGKGIMGFLFRQMLGHWRKFDIHFFDENRQEFMLAHHPFRFYFQRLEVKTADNRYLGALEKRFSIFTKRFDVLDKHDKVIMQMTSPIWKIWTFPFYYRGNEVARVEKKWSGLLTEAFTDKDKFLISFGNHNLPNDSKMIILAASLFIDLQYFEKKARRR